MKNVSSAEAFMDDVTLTARVALIQSCWHREIVDECCSSFMSSAEARGIARSSMDRFEVPGAFEIPLQAKLLAISGRYDIIVAAGFVVDGGIYRHEFVSATVIDALMKVQLDTLVPVISAVLTPQHFHEHDVHERFFRQHMKDKGEEAAEACLETLKNIRAAKNTRPAADVGQAAQKR
ncbi:MAG: 6,7-dimethyl-8-ribityllumazine synthase [Pararhodobacter sp.]